MSERKQKQKLRVHRPVFYLILGAALLIGAVKLWGPLRTARHQEAELTRLHRERDALQREHAQLQDYKNRLASDEGLETAARQQGYVKPGDRKLVFVRGKGSGARGQAPKSGARNPRP